MTKTVNLLSSGRQLGFFLCQFFFHKSLAVLQILNLLGNLLTDGIAILLEFTERLQFLFETFLLCGQVLNHGGETLLLCHSSSQFLVQITDGFLKVVTAFFK